MATVLDSFLVTLGLDASGFKSGTQEMQRGLAQTRDAVKKGADDINDRFKPVAQTILNLKRDLLGVAAIFLGGLGLKDFAQHVDAVDASVGRVASSLGMSTQALSAWESAIRRAGGSASDADSFFKSLNAHIQSVAITGQPDAVVTLLGRMGVSITDENGRAKALGDILKDIIAAVQSHRATNAQATQLISMLGGGQAMANLIEMGPGKVNELLSQAQQRGLITPEQSQAAIDFQNSLQNIRDDIESIGRVILSKLEPALTAVFNSWDKWYRSHQQLIAQDIPKYLDEVRDALGGAKDMGYALLGVFAVGTVAPVIATLKTLTSLIKGLAAAEADAAGVGTAAVAGGGLLSRLGPLGVFLYETLHPSPTEGQQQDTPNGPQGTPVSPDTPTGAYPQGYTPGAAPEGAGGQSWWGWFQRLRPNFPPAPAGSAVTIDDRVKMAHDYFRWNGYTEAQVDGILANLRAESGFDPTITNPTSGAQGIAQWLGPRLARFRQLFGHDPNDKTIDPAVNFQQQLQFIMWELQNSQATAGAALRAAQSPSDAAFVMMQSYERPSAAEQEQSGPQRMGWAEQYQRAFAVPPVALPPPVPPSPLASAGPGAGTNVENTTSIGPITITAPTGDANQIAMALKKRLDRYQFNAATNYGLA